MRDVGTMPGHAAPTCLLSDLVGRPVTSPSGVTVGAVHDVVMRLRDRLRPVVSGLVARTAGGEILFSSAAIALVSPARIRLCSRAVGDADVPLGLDEMLLAKDVLGRWYTERATADLVRARDLELSATDAGWVLSGIYTRPPRWFGLQRRPRMRDFRSWHALADLDHDVRQPRVDAARPSARRSSTDFAGLLDIVRSGARADAAAAARALTSPRRPAGSLATPWATRLA